MNWTDHGKTQRQIKRRNDVVARMNGVESGWRFVQFETFNDQPSYCQITGYPIKFGVRVVNPENGDEFVISENAAVEYVDDVVIPRRTEENTVVAEPVSIIPLRKEPSARGRGRPKKSETEREAERVTNVEPGLSARYAADPSQYVWRPRKI